MRGAPLARMILGSTAGAVVALATATRAEADAGAREAPCAHVEEPVDLPAAWAAAVAELRAQIARLQASECQPMVLTLTMAPDGRAGRIAATTSDGRRAERDVGRPEALVATGLGLLMSIPPTASATTTPTPTPTTTPRPRPRPSTTTPDLDHDHNPDADPDRRTFTHDERLARSRHGRPRNGADHDGDDRRSRLR